MIRFLSLFVLSSITLFCQDQNDPNWSGNKHKNLVILRDILKGDPDAEVPAFIGISTSRVEAFLRKEDPAMFDIYSIITQRLNAERSFFTKPIFAFKNFLSSSPYKNDSTESLLQFIRDTIKEKSLNYDWNRRNFPFTRDELNFFKSVEQQNRFLMVRSTGVEDNPNVANAGGNVSVAYVKPLVHDVQTAMADVIASYFGMQSLKNRIAGGEVLSAKQHTLPVLIQVLVGEPIGGAVAEDAIPVSGVAYTTNASLSSPNFPVTEIDASWGHGEGVVANKVAADRYFITTSYARPNSIAVYPMLYEKNERLVPSLENNTLVEMKNSSSMAHKSSLSRTQLAKLYRVLKKIETAYGQPMDVEFIVTKQKIYIVQARPAMHKKGDPSYFDLDALSPSDASTPVSFTVLVPGTGALKIITDPRKIIIAKTLDQADQMANSFSCQAVLVDTWASSLSHAAVNFMSHGTPCVYLQNMGAVRNKLNAISSKNPLIIDTQRGILFFWENGRVSPKKNIKQGWFEHPIDRTFSLFMDNAPVLPQISHIMPKDTQLIKKMLELKIATQAPVQKVLLMSINERVEKLINLTERRIKTTNYVLSPQNTQALELFKKTYHDLFLEYSAAIERKVSNFELLFYHKMLEALLYQVHTTQKVLAGYTYSYFLNDTFLRQQIQRILKSRNITHIKELDYATLCPTQELSQKWVDFITELDTISAKKSLEFLKQVQVFETLIDDLNHANSLPLWFATTFYQSTIDTVSTYSKTEPPTNKVQAFIETCAQEYTPKTRTFLHNLTSYQQSISSLSAQMHAGFTSVTAAQSRWMAIKNKLIIPLTDSEFIGEFKDAPFAIKMVACDIMNRTIDILDTTIKAVKTSKDIPLAGRIALFKSMLEDFNTVFVTWVTKIMPEEALRYHDRHPLDWYLDAMKSHYTDIVARSVDASMFQRSAHFAVNAAVLGSGTAFSRHYPRTAEDLFMLIHQNALAAVAGTLKSLFSHRTLSDLLYLPPLLETCRKDLESNGKITIAPIGISYTPDEIKISYNIPLRNHSATTQLIYNTIVQECTCAVQFLGEARGRWKEVALFANISPGLSGLKLAQNVQFDEQAGLVSWAWLIEKSNQLPTIIDYLNIMGQSLSFENNLTLDNLYTVYTGSRARDMEIKKILENYEKTFGHSYTAQWLISQLEPQSPEEPHIISL